METRSDLTRLDAHEEQILRQSTKVELKWNVKEFNSTWEAYQLEQREFRKEMLAWMKQHDPEFFSLPEFDGVDPQGWIQRANCYFDLNGISSNLRIQLTQLSMIGLAKHWFTIVTQIYEDMSWEQFQVELLQRFNEVEIQNSLGTSMISVSMGESLRTPVLGEVGLVCSNTPPFEDEDEVKLVVSESESKSNTTPPIQLLPFIPAPLPLMTLKAESGKTSGLVPYQGGMREKFNSLYVLHFHGKNPNIWTVGAECSSMPGDYHWYLAEFKLGVERKRTTEQAINLLGRPPPSPPPPPLPSGSDEKNGEVPHRMMLEYEPSVVGMPVPSMEVTEEVTLPGHCVHEFKKKTWAQIRELGHSKAKLKFNPRTIESKTSPICTSSSPLLIDTPLTAYIPSWTIMGSETTLSICSKLVSKNLVFNLFDAEMVTVLAEIKQLMSVISNTFYTKKMFLRVLIINYTEAPKTILISTHKHMLDSQPKLCDHIISDKTNNKAATVKAWVATGLGAAGKMYMALCTVIIVEVATNEEIELVKVFIYVSTVTEHDAINIKQPKQGVYRLTQNWLVLTVKPSLDGLLLCDVSIFSWLVISDVIEKVYLWDNEIGSGPTEMPSFEKEEEEEEEEEEEDED
ncbi:hypothetical protein LXL04_023208 [Taraxacum kok-saghyz]